MGVTSIRDVARARREEMAAQHEADLVGALKALRTPVDGRPILDEVLLTGIEVDALLNVVAERDALRALIDSTTTSH